MDIVRFLWRTLLICWASPYTLMGLVVGACGLMTGGKMRVRDRAIEFYGGGTKWFVRHLPLGECTTAITLGHVILGQSELGLENCAKHERVHVRQFERLGPFMGPAYLLSSAWMWAIGGDAYRDNYFERDAYDEDSSG